MHDVPPETTARFASAVGPQPDEVLEGMEGYARREGFPIVGPAVGGWLRLLALAVDARRVFEFGSGFGYSAYWFATALPADGRVVLTERDADELERAREYFERGGLADRAAFEHGDAVEIVEAYDGPFEAVLLDNEKHRYVEAFETVRGKVPAGGVVVADNVMAGPVEFDSVFALVEGDAVETDESTRGIADYLDHVRADPAFETAVLPLGSGVSVSVRTG